MDTTRVDTKKLQIAVLKASGHLDEAAKALRPYFVVLTDKERAATLRPPNTFLDAGRTLARAAVSHPEIDSSRPRSSGCQRGGSNRRFAQRVNAPAS